MEQYDSYLICIHKSLEARGITAKELSGYLLKLPALKVSSTTQKALLAEFEVEIQRATSVKEIIDLLGNNFGSFLDYDIFSNVVREFGISENRDAANTEILKYPEHFKTYAVRQKLSDIIGVIPNAEKLKNSSEELSIKFEVDISEYSLANLMELKSEIADVLNLQESTLRLFNIEEGCIVVTFLIPSSLAHFILPKGKTLALHQMKSLRDLSALQLKCCGEMFILRHKDTNLRYVCIPYTISTNSAFT